MMGNRGARGGSETDAFSKKSRGILNWKPGVLKKLKRAFSKRARKSGRDATAREAGQ